jgi:hypothetical protein
MRACHVEDEEGGWFYGLFPRFIDAGLLIGVFLSSTVQLRC